MKTSNRSCILCGENSDDYQEHLQLLHGVKINLEWLINQCPLNQVTIKVNDKVVDEKDTNKENEDDEANMEKTGNDSLEFVNVDSLPVTPSLPTWLKDEQRQRRGTIRKVTLDPLDFVNIRRSFSKKNFKYLLEGSLSDEVLIQVRRKMNKVGSALTPFRIITKRTPKLKKTSRKSLSTHKLHACDVCHKKFTRSLELKSHMKSHSEKRPFPCDKCGETFKGKHLLLKHEKIFHPVFGTPQAVYKRLQ